MASSSDSSDNGDGVALLEQREISPVVAVHRDRKDIQKGRGPSSSRLKEKIEQFFWILLQERCRALKNVSRATKCTCMIVARGYVTDEDIKSIVPFLFNYGLMEQGAQRKLLAEWMRYAMALKSKTKENRTQCFLMPGLLTTRAMICQHAMGALLGMSHKSWFSLKSKVKNNQPIFHGLSRKLVGNRKNKDHDAMFRDFFEEMKAFASPRATRIVRTLVGNQTTITLRDDDADLLELPTSFTKRKLYSRFLLENG